MNEREALLKAICENPDDDTPRLVYADWLDEHGEPERAEFIRVQIELEKCRWDARRRLEERADELLRLHGQEWRKAFEFGPYHWWRFRRGFVYYLEAREGTQLLRDMDAVFAAAPIQCLEVSGELDLIPLLSSRHVARLTHLIAYSARLTAGSLESLVERDWKFHPQKLLLSPEGLSHDLRDEIVARFVWVSFSRWN